MMFEVLQIPQFPYFNHHNAFSCCYNLYCVASPLFLVCCRWGMLCRAANPFGFVLSSFIPFSSPLFIRTICFCWSPPFFGFSLSLPLPPYLSHVVPSLSINIPDGPISVPPFSVSSLSSISPSLFSLLSELSSGVVDQSDSLLGPRWPGPGRLLQLPAQSLWPGGGAAEVSTQNKKKYITYASPIR